MCVIQLHIYYHRLHHFILEQEKAVIIALDFTKFFDTLDHKNLKENIKGVLGSVT